VCCVLFPAVLLRASAGRVATAIVTIIEANITTNVPLATNFRISIISLNFRCRLVFLESLSSVDVRA
jgi:hypothetical protein